MKAFQSFAFFLIFSIVECNEMQCTTPNIKEIILGRCNDYLNNIQISPTPIKYIDVNCTTVWDTFYNSFALKKRGYKEFFDLFESENLIDKALFWSKTNKLAHEYTSVKGSLYTLEDTLPGYLANGLLWHGCTYDTQPGCTNGINYGKCDGYSNTSTLYWKLASIKFSNMAQGKAFVMLNGSVAPKVAFAKDSALIQHELPTIKYNEQVKELVVYVIKSLKTEILTNCVKAEEIIKEIVVRDIKCSCDERASDAQLLFCAKNPDSDDCILNEIREMKSESEGTLRKLKKARKVRKARKHDN